MIFDWKRAAGSSKSSAHLRRRPPGENVTADPINSEIFPIEFSVLRLIRDAICEFIKEWRDEGRGRGWRRFICISGNAGAQKPRKQSERNELNGTKIRVEATCEGIPRKLST